MIPGAVRRVAAVLLTAACLHAAAGCATYNDRTQAAWAVFENGRPAQAAELYREASDGDAKNEFLYRAEEGASWLAARDFERAEQALLEAAALIDPLEYMSLSEHGLSLARDDHSITYGGEQFEKVLVHVLFGLSALDRGDAERAAVAARRVDMRLHDAEEERGEHHRRMPFARLASGWMFEAAGDFNNAYVVYRLAHEQEPDLPGLGAGLVRCAERLGLSEEAAKWRAEYGAQAAAPAPGEGVLVVVHLAGIGPRKIPGPTDPVLALPAYAPGRAPGPTTVAVRRAASGDAPERAGGDTREPGMAARPSAVETYARPALDVSALAKADLDARMAWLAARKAAGFALKEGAAQVVRHNYGPEAYLATTLLLHATDRVDLRYWRTLPDQVRVLRTNLPAGTWDVTVQVDRGRWPAGPDAPAAPGPRTFTADIRPGGLTVLVVRTIP